MERTTRASDSYSTVAGGFYNTVSGEYGALVGGYNNEVGGSYSIVGGGSYNETSGENSTVGGGYSNAAKGTYSTVAGGDGNVAGGTGSFAAGHRAKVRDPNQVGGGDTDGDQGTFVWGDSINADFTSTGPNQFLIRATGGVGLGTNNPSGFQLAVNGAAAKPGGGSWSTPVRHAGQGEHSASD